MTEKLFELTIEKEEIGKRVRAILGVPETFLTDDVINSPIFIERTSKYINKAIKEYSEQLKEFEKVDYSLLEIASMYYVSYLLCIGMDARLPKQMENLSTKTLLQNINWDAKALELLNKVHEIIEEFLLEYDIEDDGFNSFAVLTDVSEYPETNI